MRFIKEIFKKETILFAFLIIALILTAGTVSANDTNTIDSSDLNLDDEYNININDDSNQIKSVLSSDNENLSLNNNENSALNQDPISDETQASDENPSSNEIPISNGHPETFDFGFSISGTHTDFPYNYINPIDGSFPVNDISNLRKIDTRIHINTSTIEKGSNLTIELKDMYGIGMPNQTLLIHINTKNYTRTTDENGQAFFQINLPSKDYYTIIAYEGKDLYDSTHSALYISVKPMKTKISITNKSVVKERSLILELLDKNNNPINKQNITITVNNKKYTNKTNSKGLAYFKISLATGKYTVKAIYNGNENYINSSKNFTITVYKLKTNFTIPKTSIIRGKSVYIYLKDINGKSVPSSKVTIKFNGKTYTKTTNKNGRVSFKISKLGHYALKLSYAGGNSYLQRSQSFNIYSHNVNTKFIVTNYSVVRGKSLKIILKDSKNNNLPGKKVTFTILKKSYTKTTDSNGKASLQLTKVPGSYSITLNFNGDMGYLKSKRTAKIKILKNTTADITAKNQTKHLNGNSTVKYYVKLTDNKGNPIFNETIKLKVKCNNITTGSGNKITKKTIVLSSDNIIDKATDKKLLNEMAKILREKGYKVIVSGIGPNYHVTDVRDYSNVCVFSLVGGVDSGMFVDMASNYYKNYLKYNNNQFVLGCVAPPVYLNLGNMTWLRRAHDDDYSPASFKGLYYPGKYFNKVTKLDYVYGADAEELVNNFLKYAKNGKSIDLGQSTPKTTNTYKVTTNKYGNAYIELPVGTYSITSSIINSDYKVDTVTSTLNVIK